MKSASKVNAKASATVVLSQSVKTLINEAVGADEAATVAATNRDQKLAALAKALTAIKGERDAIRTSVEPLWETAFQVANKKRNAKKQLTKEACTKYAGEQLSRLFTLVKTLRGESPVKHALPTVERMISEGKPWNTVLAGARGGMKYDKAGKLAVVKNDNRGGHNAKKPLETFADVVGNAVTAAKTAKLDLVPLGNAFIDALKACELIDEDEAEQLQAAFNEIG